MMEFQQSSIWQKTLAKQMEPDYFEKQRDFLRVEFENFREKAKLLAGEISRVLPDFTVHDITHIDALWETAEIAVKGNVELNPAEAFVLGGAFLIHDLGMGLASFPKGIEELKEESIWIDTAASLLKEKLGRAASKDDFIRLDKDIERAATEHTLRILHAKQAGRLAKVSWKDSRGNEIFLIDNTELREAYGNIIGLIAYSHWWRVSELEEKLHTELGALSLFPSEWTIDPIKLACILRIADAAQIDDRRAPSFLRTIRKPSRSSDLHWNFQQKLYQPRLDRNRLVYTSKSPFSINEVNDWWICFDTLKMIDNELKEVDSLLANTNRARFGVIGVAGIDDPKRLSKLISVDGWQPVDTKIRVNNVAKLVGSIGGRQLYGKDLVVPLRELIQNASDAIRARRVIENEPDIFGDITIRIGKDENGKYIEVEDNGIGMSESVLTGPFLDFGQSFWGTTLMHEELPGLESKGFSSTGKYGIGFFSVFMWGEKVSIISNRYDKGRDNTLVLEFTHGLSSRPILRGCREKEAIKNGGTRIRVWLTDEVLNGILELDDDRRKKGALSEILEGLCPSIDCNILIEEKGKLKTIIKANDWITISSLNLIKRIMGKSKLKELSPIEQKLITDISKNMTIIKNEDGHIVGRLALFNRSFSHKSGFFIEGVVTVGGFKTTRLTALLGVLIGTSETAARDVGIPVVSNDKLKEWATNQAKLLSKLGLDEELQIECASFVSCCGGNTGDLKIAYHKSGAVNFNEIKKITEQTKTDNYVIIHDAALHIYERNNSCKVDLAENVFSVGMGLPGIFQTHMYNYYYDWPEHSFGISDNDVGCSLDMVVTKAISDSWGYSLAEMESATDLSSDKKDIKAIIGNVNGNPIMFGHVDIIKRLG